MGASFTFSVVTAIDERYDVEVGYYFMRLKLTKDLETEINNLFAIGDGAGVTHGLIQASVSGVVAAREVGKRTTK